MNMFFNYAVSLVYKEPQYDSFIRQQQVVKEITTQEACVAVGGQWTENTYPQPVEKNQIQPKGYCNQDYTNQLNYDAAKKVYDRNVFITLVVLGVISLIAGAFVSVGILALSFSWGGVLSIIIASMRYWSSADNLIKVIILAVALGVLIWLAVKKFSK